MRVSRWHFCSFIFREDRSEGPVIDRAQCSLGWRGCINRVIGLHNVSKLGKEFNVRGRDYHNAAPDPDIRV